MQGAFDQPVQLQVLGLAALSLHVGTVRFLGLNLNPPLVFANTKVLRKLLTLTLSFCIYKMGVSDSYLM